MIQIESRRIDKVVVLILILVWSKSFGSCIDVCPNCQYNSIETALVSAEEGDTIHIIGGEYKVENIAITKSVSIIGQNQPIIISKSGDEIFTIIAHNVTISGITFRDVTTSYLKERSAIRVKKQSNFIINGNRIENCFFAIYIENAKSGIIENNIIIGNATTEAESGNGIHAWYCKDIKIVGNEISKQRDGIYLEFVNNSSIRSNLSKHNTRYGLHFMFSNDNEYLINTFDNNGVGVAVMFSSRIQMHQNKFIYNWGRSAYGLLLKEINDATIEDNLFENNTIGIFVEGSNRIQYSRNTFKQNGWAVKFSGGCDANKVSYNNFLNNSLDLVVTTKLSSNVFDHNYWSNYTGYDLDRNDVGDVPYYPVKLFSFILDQIPEAIVLMRSFFVDLINFSEQVSPVFTPKEVKDDHPLMFPVL